MERERVEPAPHPAKFSDAVLKAALTYLRPALDDSDREKFMLDPFAGVGKGAWVADQLSMPWIGVEIEPEWAVGDPRIIVGDSRKLVKLCGKHGVDDVNVIFTSPVYGNRMSDHHDAKDQSKRITYRHKLGRKLNRNNAGGMHFGKKGGEYEKLHEKVWSECFEVLDRGGWILVNVKNFMRGGREVDVVGWHRNALWNAGFYMDGGLRIPTPGMRYGKNGEKRVDGEVIIVARKL